MDPGVVMTSDLFGVLHEAPGRSLFWTYVFGVLWGLGGLTFGLTMRYLGMSLGMAVALGYTAAFGTLDSANFSRAIRHRSLGTRSGLTILFGVAVCLLGIVLAGAAGVSKERELSEIQKRAAIKEFNLKKGLLVATFSGVMSACFAYGLAAGDPIKALTVLHGTPTLWQGLPVLVVLLLGGFTTNFIWCAILNFRNRTFYQYFNSRNSKVKSRPSCGTDYRECDRRTCGGNGGSVRQCETQPRPRPDAIQLFLLRARGNHLVHAVLLLHHGRNPDGTLQVFQLDAAHGQHHHFQHALGYRAERMERHRSTDQMAGSLQPVGTCRVDHDRRLRQLSRYDAFCFARVVRAMISSNVPCQIYFVSLTESPTRMGPPETIFARKPPR